MSGIEDAAQLWVGGDREGAFEALCGVWADAQDLALGELCEQISEVLVRERWRALAELSPAERHASLMAAAKAGDRTAVHALLPWLTSVARPKARQRVAFLEPPDPTLLRNLGYWLRRRPELNGLAHYLVTHRSWWLDLQNAWWNGEATAELDRYTRENGRWLRRAPSERSLGPADARALASFRAHFDAEPAPARVRAEALLRAIEEHPHEDSHRALLADFLLSQDQHDPRGELINLQLRAAAGELPEHALARAGELLDLHGFRWLGPLARDCVLPSVRFERGFLVGLDLFSNFRNRRADFGAPGHPLWATVEALNGGTWAIVSHPIMRSLRSLGCDPSCARALLGGPVRASIEALSITVPELQRIGSYERPRAAHNAVLSLAHELLAKLDALPSLRHLRLRDSIYPDPGAWQWLWQGPRAGLSSVRLRADMDYSLRLEQWCEVLRSDDSRVELLLDYGKLCFALVPGDGYRTIRVSHSVPRWRMQPSRDELLGFIVHALTPSLSAAGLRRIEVVGAIVDTERLRAELGGHALESVIV